MVLVDTSVLINYFKGSIGEEEKKFEDLLNKKIPFGISPIIYQELLQGARDQKEFALLESYLSSQKFYDVKRGINSYKEAALLYLKCREKGVTIRSTVDLLIAQTAIENDLFLLHNDKDFTNMSKIIKELKIY
jgi:predicted nucleic acid-binding protein